MTVHAQGAGTDEYVVGLGRDPVPLHNIISFVQYPAAAIDSNWEGKSAVLALVDLTGHVRKVKLDESSGHAVLDTAALRAVVQSTYTPATSLGEPVAMWFRVLISFKISDSVRTHLAETLNEMDADPEPLIPLQSLVAYPPEQLSNIGKGKRSYLDLSIRQEM